MYIFYNFMVIIVKYFGSLYIYFFMVVITCSLCVYSNESLFMCIYSGERVFI